MAQPISPQTYQFQLRQLKRCFLIFIVFVSSPLFFSTCHAKTDALHFIMEVDEVKTQTSASGALAGSGICIIYGPITKIISDKGVSESNLKLKSGWRSDFEEGENISVVVACKDEYFSEQLGVVSLIKSSVKSAKLMEFWGNDLRDSKYRGCERYGDCTLSGRFIFSPKGAKILEQRK